MPVAALTWVDAAYLALAVFLVATGLTLAYVFLQLGATLRSLSAFIRGTQEEFVPVIGKVGGTIDRVNAQLDKVDQMTDSAVEAANSADAAVRALSRVVITPVRKLAGLAAGVSYGASSLRARRSWREAVDTGKEAAARREHELDEELHRSRRGRT